jgi:hypothetical protein
MGGALVTLVLWAATADAQPAVACPAREAVETEIGRLGAAPALAQTGTPDISVGETGMRIVLHGHDGKVLGMRQVAAPQTCPERAVVAAVVIVAWLGEWSGGPPVAPGAAVERPAAPPPAPAATVTAPRTPLTKALTHPTRPRDDVALFGFGVHDGDAGTWGGGAQLDYGLGQHLAVIALGEGTGERSRALGPGEAAYRSWRFGAGLAWRQAFGRAFIDAGVAPAAVRLSLRGQGLETPRTAINWSLAMDGRMRLGLRLSQVAAFIFGDGGYALSTARLTLDNRPDSVTLSRWSFAAGLGLLFSFGPLGG